MTLRSNDTLAQKRHYLIMKIQGKKMRLNVMQNENIINKERDEYFVE